GKLGSNDSPWVAMTKREGTLIAWSLHPACAMSTSIVAATADSAASRRTMNTAPPQGGSRLDGDFRHEALFYDGLDGWLEGTTSFVREGLEADDATFVVAGANKLEALKAELGPGADLVQFADMHEVGLNPARIIPAWTDFLAQSAP